MEIITMKRVPKIRQSKARCLTHMFGKESFFSAVKVVCKLLQRKTAFSGRHHHFLGKQLEIKEHNILKICFILSSIFSYLVLRYIKKCLKTYFVLANNRCVLPVYLGTQVLIKDLHFVFQ